MPNRRSLVLVTGAEGAGKTTIMRALLPHAPNAAKVDAEDVGQVNPFVMDESFLRLLRANIHALVENFWRAGYSTVITGSFLGDDTRSSVREFLVGLSAHVDISLVHLRASRAERDRRRIAREKPSTKEWRDRVDASYPDRTDLNEGTGYRYIPIDNDSLSVDRTVARIVRSIPEVFDGH